MVARSFVPSLLAIGMVVSVISSLGAPLIPTIAVDLHASLGAAQWSLTATLLVGAVASPLLGRLGDGPHRRRVMLVCLALVTLGGVVAALAASLGALVAGRALQGIGLGLMPLTMAAARDHLAGSPRSGPVIAQLSIIAAAGVGLGYPITGLIAEQFDAAAAFWFGAIASGAAFVVALRFVPDASPTTRSEPLDVRGAVLVGAGVLALLLALEQGPDWGWGARQTLGLFVLAVVLLALWTANELRVAFPLVELRLLRRRAVLTANAVGLVLGVAMYLGIALITQLVQLPDGIDGSVFAAGLTLLPLSVFSLGSNRLAPILRHRAGQRATIPVGATLMAGAMLFIAATGDAYWQACVTMGLVGLGLGLTFAAMPGLIVSAVPPHETGSAMSFYQVSRYVGFSIGSGLAVTLLRAFGDGAAAPGEGAYHATFVVGGALCLLAAGVAWVLLPSTATGGDGRREPVAQAGTLGVR